MRLSVSRNLYGILHLVGSVVSQIVSDPKPDLYFKVVSGGNDNYFFRDSLTSAQVVLTSANSTSVPRRLVVALPAGNTGALTYFWPTGDSSTLGVDLVEDSVTSTTAGYFNAGVQADLVFNGNATLGVTIVGSVRAMRDYVEGGGVMRDIFNYTLAEHNETSVRLHRRWINTTSPASAEYNGADLYLTVPPSSAVRLSVTPGYTGSCMPPTIDVVLPEGAKKGVVTVKVVTNETTLPGLNTQDLFLPESTNGTQALQTVLQGLATGNATAAQQVSFLTYADKYTAGGWRFLTYFVRDTLIALRLLMPMLTSEAIESALGAVIERTNATGALCHEETIGKGRSVENWRHLLLLPAMSHYFLDLPQGSGRAAQFLARNATLQSGTYAEILNRTVFYNLERAAPFVESPAVSNLIGLRPGQPVGNWRDSNEGLGFGFYPFDVNAALVPASLRATQALVDAGILSSTQLDAAQLGEMATVWEERAPGLFEVTVDGGDAERRLKNFVEAANLSEALLEGGRSASGVSFYALSLKEDGTPVEVLHSDLGFNLVYGTNVSREVLQRVVDALQPYPRGLLTNVGMVVANPAYDSNETTIDVLSRAAYHGTVVWSFQQALMASGLARQLGFCVQDDTTTVDINPAPATRPSWCTDSEFVQALRDAQTRLWTSIRGAKDEMYSEVWSYSFDSATNTFSVADLAGLSPSGTESDAIQLWFYGFLGLLDPDAGAR
ncbi:hypothetical protein C8Q76DRAFT_811912 [Earliella scabrosa]|nr:hypothetical protein C8Q76DRAFT_811912 [Earliella scabrosa]